MNKTKIILTNNYLKLYQRLETLIAEERMFYDPLHTLAFGTDASFYRLIPKLVVKAKDESEVSFILNECLKLLGNNRKLIANLNTG